MVGSEKYFCCVNKQVLLRVCFRGVCSCCSCCCLYLFLSLYPFKVQVCCPGHTSQLSGLCCLYIFGGPIIHLRFKHAVLGTHLSYLGSVVCKKMWVLIFIEGSSMLF